MNSLEQQQPVEVFARTVPVTHAGDASNSTAMRGVREVDALRVTSKGCAKSSEAVAIEMRADIFFNGIHWATAALSPFDLEDYVYGAALSAGVISHSSGLTSVDVRFVGESVVIEATLGKGASFEGAGGEGCAFAPSAHAVPGCRIDKTNVLSKATDDVFGVCERSAFDVPVLPLEPAAIWRMSSTLLQSQGMHRATGATHAAVLADRMGNPVIIREDVGRHNAVDKLMGAMLRAHACPSEGFVYLSSRCALELVAKCAQAGVLIVATVSAPTTAVLDFAEQENITLCAFARDERFTVYTHPERIAL